VAWRLLIGILVALGAVWAIFVVFLFVARPPGTSVGDAARLLPDVVRLVRRVATDRSLPRRVRWPVWLLLGYLALPIDLVPDFLPVIGYADDVIITLVVLRFVAHRAGPEALRRHWPGTDAGLEALFRLAHVHGTRRPTRGERVNGDQTGVD
jgi:uncharacterized membrane protein YkvA (DUF1232 family)